MDDWKKRTLETYIGKVELEYHSEEITNGLFGKETIRSHFQALLIGENDRIIQTGEGITARCALVDLFTEFGKVKMREAFGIN